MDDAESSCDTYEQAVGVDMPAQTVDLGLLHIAQITDAQGHFAADSGIEGQHMSPLGGADKGGGHNVMVVVALREDFVVGLPIVRREHDTAEWQCQLIAC